MAEVLKRWQKFRLTIPGQLLLALAYFGMLCAVLAFFTGNGEFIYEGF